MKQEMQLFDSTENPSPNIIKLCDALKTIPPTSVEAKRAFSAAGLFVTKLRTRVLEVLETSTASTVAYYMNIGKNPCLITCYDRYPTNMARLQCILTYPRACLLGSVSQTVEHAPRLWSILKS
ncbi:hypothetical protein TNCV_2193811 [Trichonephila clavipes]|uniref:HAT C-terminal dimerisation domain-containing protein n=1 Tax=Trichonephila clavipes TaxID=2585209 RepID=A0A8X6SG36_TRICX|nr:hypothetical protein TNCV_2193811 [Trichonephila clavipes]